MKLENLERQLDESMENVTYVWKDPRTDTGWRYGQEPLKVYWDFLVKCTKMCKDVQGLGKIGNDCQEFGMSLEELTT